MANSTVATQTVECYPMGDVVFICGNNDDGDAQTKIKVFSKIVMSMSPTFKAMVEPRLEEVQKLGTTSIVEIPLPDDPKIMVIILNVLHLRSAAIPEKLQSQQLVDVVHLADKYGCTSAIRFHGAVWVTALKDEDDHIILGRLLTASFHLNMTALFGEISSSIVKNSRKLKDVQSDSAVYGVRQHEQDGFGKTFELLEAYKHDRFVDIEEFVKTTIHGIIHARDIPNDTTSCLLNCHVVEVALYELLRKIQQKSLEPSDNLVELPLKRALQALREIPPFPYTPRILPCSPRCIFHNLIRLQNFAEFALLQTPPPKLLCLVGYHELGQGKDWNSQCKAGYCEHCGDSPLYVVD